MEYTEYNIHDIYQDLLTINHKLDSIRDYGTEELKLAETVIKHLQLLEKLNIFNATRDSQYKSELGYSNKKTIEEWTKNMSEYVHLGLQGIINYLVDKEDKSGFKYFLTYYKNIFEQSSHLSHFLKTASDRLESITKKNSGLDLTIKKAESDQNRIGTFTETLTTAETRITALDETITALGNKSALLEGIKNFQQISDEYKSSSKTWMKAGVTVTIILVIYAICRLFDYSQFTKISSNISCMFADGFREETVSTTLYIAYGKYILANLFIVSLLLFAISVCVKNYRSNMHNYIICRHKASSLDSANKLINNTNSPEIHQFILASASNAIFSHQNTGYNNNDESDNNVNLAVLSKLMESVRPKQVQKTDDLPF